jgi:hypothetical protein
VCVCARAHALYVCLCVCLFVHMCICACVCANEVCMPLNAHLPLCEGPNGVGGCMGESGERFSEWAYVCVCV